MSCSASMKLGFLPSWSSQLSEERQTLNIYLEMSLVIFKKTEGWEGGGRRALASLLSG